MFVQPQLAFWHPGPMEIVILLVVALLLFGRKLPEVARSMGKGIVEFKRGLRDVETDIERESSAPPPLTAPQQPPASSPPADSQPSPEDRPSSGDAAKN